MKFLFKRILVSILVVIAIICIVFVTNIYIRKDITKTHDIAGGNYLGYALELSIASQFHPSVDIYYGRAFEKNPVCVVSDGVFEVINIDECRFTWSTKQSSDFCRWYNLGSSCVGLIIPSIYFNNKSFSEKIFSAVKSPCAVFFDRNISSREFIFQKLYCHEGKNYTKYDVYLAVIEKNWDNFESFDELDKEAKILSVYYFDKDEKSISKIQ